MFGKSGEVLGFSSERRYLAGISFSVCSAAQRALGNTTLGTMALKTTSPNKNEVSLQRSFRVQCVAGRKI